MKKFLKKLNVNMIVFAIMTLITILFIGFIAFTNILPFKYLILLVVVLAIPIAIIGVLLLKFKKKKKLHIVAYVISAIMALVMAIIFYYLNSTMDFIGKFNKDKYKEENFLVLVLEDSRYQDITELKDQKIGYISNELTNINKALDELNNKITYEKVQMSDSENLLDSLFKNEVEAVIIEENQKALIEENKDEKHDLRVLYTITIKTEMTDIKTNVNVSKEPFAIYLTGIDTFGSINSVSRSDVNIVAVVNPNTKQVLLISIPRDYYVQINGTTGLKDKLTHTGIYGIDTSVKTIEDLLEMDISYYFKVNFSSVIKIVDQLGGIDVYSKYTFKTSRNNSGHYTFYKGYNHMNGDQALAFVRERYNLPGGDRSRGENQQAVISGLINKATSSAIITKYNSILKSLEGTFQTNMDEKEITNLIKMQLNDMAKWNVTSINLDGRDGHEYTYSYPHQKLYVMLPKEETVSNAIDLINRVENGEVLDKSYEDPSDIKDPTNVTYPKPKPQPEQPTVTVKDPTISLLGNKTVAMLANDVYEEKGVTISVDLTDDQTKLEDVKIEGEVDPTLAGTYNIKYTITDKFGKSATVMRTVIVLDPTSDYDGDGYSNQKEFDAKTDPLDKDSHPNDKPVKPEKPIDPTPEQPTDPTPEKPTDPTPEQPTPEQPTPEEPTDPTPENPDQEKPEDTI